MKYYIHNLYDKDNLLSHLIEKYYSEYEVEDLPLQCIKPDVLFEIIEKILSFYNSGKTEKLDYDFFEILLKGLNSYVIESIEIIPSTMHLINPYNVNYTDDQFKKLILPYFFIGVKE